MDSFCTDSAWESILVALTLFRFDSFSNESLWESTLGTLIIFSVLALTFRTLWNICILWNIRWRKQLNESTPRRASCSWLRRSSRWSWATNEHGSSWRKRLTTAPETYRSTPLPLVIETLLVPVTSRLLLWFFLTSSFCFLFAEYISGRGGDFSLHSFV